MAERNFKKKIEEQAQGEKKVQYFYDVQKRDVLTGDSNQSRHLYYQLKRSMMQAEQIDIIVSFLMESGVRMLIRDFQRAIDRGAKIRILTGNYLGITQPGALYLIKKELNDKADLRIYHDSKRSFHPKAYIFHENEEKEIYIGSSNISKSALTSGIEWNYRFSSLTDEENYQLFFQTFEDLFYHHAVVLTDEELKKYARNWRKPAIYKDLERYDANDKFLEKEKEVGKCEPSGVQIEALYELEKARKEGAKRALIQAATGVGKTYLAAFDSKDYKRVLFIAHREEILHQAAESFYNVRKSEDYGYFYGTEKETEKAVIFASVASLGKEEYLNENYFRRDYFDYIVIDEFHHAVNQQYRNIIAYFEPEFLLGLTATPERMDGRNIYELCDYVVPYEIGLKDAINKGILVPFRYYGIFDETVDYNQLQVTKGKYAEAELTKELMKVKRYELIYDYYMKYPSKRALGFCCSRMHAEAMAQEFRSRGVKAVAVYSSGQGAFAENREAAIEKLRAGEIQVIFSVDMFNEGVDIKELDMVMFLRPTESSTVFLQQLGRGLRKCKGKEYLTVLDFIGNYEKAGHAPFLLSGQPYSKTAAYSMHSEDFVFPDECIVDFDLKLIDLFQKMAEKTIKKKDIIRKEYSRVKEWLDGKVPSRMELFTYMDDEIYELCLTSPKENPFSHYFDFLEELQELSEEEEKLCQGIGKEFLHYLETTSMTKSYKMPILLAFFHHGNIKMQIDEEDVWESCKTFYDRGMNWKDLVKKGEGRDAYLKWDRKKQIQNAKRNPIKYLKESGSKYFEDREGYLLGLNEKLKEWTHMEAFCVHMKDIIAYRTMNYYRSRYQEETK